MSDSAEPRWQESDSEDFLDLGRYFVPDRERQIEILCDLVPPPEDALLVELCCGEGLISRALLERFPACRVHALDGSPRMLEHAKTTCAALGQYGDRFTTQLFDLAETGWRRFERPVHAFVTSLAVHHLDGDGKRQLFADLHRALAPGGCLLVADLVLPAGESGVRVAAKQWDLAVRERSLQLSGDLRAFERFEELEWNSYRATEPDPVDQPSTLLDQLEWMEAAGFTDVDVYWMLAGHVIFGGFKAA